MGKRSVLSILDLPAITDRRQELAAWSFSHILAPTMMNDQPLMRFICFVAGIHALEHGLSSAHAYPMAMLGVLLSSDFYDFEVGYQFAVLATRICDRFQNLSDKSTPHSIPHSTAAPSEEMERSFPDCRPPLHVLLLTVRSPVLLCCAERRLW